MSKSIAAFFGLLVAFTIIKPFKALTSIEVISVHDTKEGGKNCSSGAI
jgi:hypothetical protein